MISTLRYYLPIYLILTLSAQPLSAELFNYSKQTIIVKLIGWKKGTSDTHVLAPGKTFSPEKKPYSDMYVSMQITSTKTGKILVNKLNFNSKLDYYMSEAVSNPTSKEYIPSLFFIRSLTTSAPIKQTDYTFNFWVKGTPLLTNISFPQSLFEAGSITDIDNQTSSNYTIQASAKLPIVYANTNTRLLANNRKITLPNMFSTNNVTNTQSQITLVPDDPKTVPTITLIFDTKTNIMTIESAVQNVPYSSFTFNVGTLKEYVPTQNLATGIAGWDFALTINADNTLEIKKVNIYETYVNRSNNIAQHAYPVTPQSATKSDWDGSAATNQSIIAVGEMCQTGLLTGIKNAGESICSAK